MKKVNGSVSRNLLADTRAQIVVAILLVALIFAARILPHAANFTPVAAVGLFAGVYLRRSWALFVPLAGLILSDLVLGGYGVRGMAVVYGAFALTFVVGRLISRKNFFAGRKIGAKIARGVAGTLFASILFFLITNNIFLYTPSLYPMDFAGMIQSYAAGVPFFRAQILGDAIYSFSLFGAYEVAKIVAASFIKSRKTAKISEI